MKAFVIVFAILGIANIVAAFWNPLHIGTAFCCAIMVINGIGHIKENV